jgi:hypothetical protein
MIKHCISNKTKALIGILVLFISASDAQNNHFKQDYFIGISGGATGSMVYFKPLVNQDFLYAYHGGLTFRYINEKSLGLQAELNYSQRGWSELDNSFVKRLDYLEIPFLTHVYFGNNIRFFFNFGPKIGYLLNETIILNNNPTSTSEQHIQPVQNKIDYGLALGLGCMFKIKKQIFQFEARANYSASDLFSNDRRDYFDNSNLIHGSATLGWLLQVNK